jgi:ABC-2 type transport system permease protein
VYPSVQNEGGVMFRVIGRIFKKELIQAVRDKRMFAVILIAPILQTILFGFALNLDLSSQPLVIADVDRSVESRQLIDAIVATDGFVIAGYVLSDKEAEDAVWKGRAALALFIPRGYAQDLSRGDAEVQVIVDGSDSNTALRASQEISQILSNHVLDQSKVRIKQTLLQQGISPDRMDASVSITPRAWFNPQLRSSVFMVPGVLGMVLMVITMVLTSMGLTREKEIGTLEQIMVSPVKPWELIIGKVLPFAFLGMVDVAFITALITVVFDLPPMGSMLTLFGVSAIFLLTTLGLGLFISTVSATQQQAMMTAFFVLLPAVMLSGFVFPVDNIPLGVRWVADINPMRYYLELVRGIIVKGSTLGDLYRPTLLLTVVGVTVFTSASLRFKKRNA